MYVEPGACYLSNIIATALYDCVVIETLYTSKIEMGKANGQNSSLCMTPRVHRESCTMREPAPGSYAVRYTGHTVMHIEVY